MKRRSVIEMGHHKLERVLSRVRGKTRGKIAVWKAARPSLFSLSPHRYLSTSHRLVTLPGRDRPVTNIGRLGCNKPSGVTDHPSCLPLLRQYYVTRRTSAYASRKIARGREMRKSARPRTRDVIHHGRRVEAPTSPSETA